MKRIASIVFVLLSITAYSQTITVDDTSKTPADLVDLLLGNSCVTGSNISSSSAQSVAYFNKNGSSFPISEGIIIRNGNATNTQGLYTGLNMSTNATGGGTDAFLQNLSNISSGQNTALVDLAYLQFDFTPISNSFSFDFLFASNEYGQFQCLSNDIFAFELTDLTTNITTNLAVIPGTTNPVTVKNIKNALYNNTCGSTNPNLFGVYNVNNPAASALNMRGHTVVLNASSTVLPNNPYRLKLAIGDYGDFEYDSAVFIAAGSFENTFDLGADRTICTGDTFVLDTNLDNSFTYIWFLNGISIPGATNPTYTVTQPGTYSVAIRKGTCFLTDTVIFNNLMVNTPINLQTCNNGSTNYTFDLTTNNETQLGIDGTQYDIFYYESLTDIASNTPIPNGNLASYSSAGSQTIYIKLFNTQTNSFCDAVYAFNLIVSNPVTAGTNINIEVCDSIGGQSYNLLNANLYVLNGLPSTDYTVTYYNSQSDAEQGTNSIGYSINIPSGSNSITVWAQLQDNSNPNCIDVTSVVITVNPLPVVDTISSPVECSSFTLPVITNGTYYSGPDGTGTQYNAGDVLDLSGTYYIFVGPDANGCTNQSNFNVYLMDEYVPTLDNCGSFTVPAPPYNIGAFYTAPGGPNGTGILIPTGTTYTNSTQTAITQNLYYYAEVHNLPCVDTLFTINIHPIPLIDILADVTTCNSYTLPIPTNGSYYTLPGGPTAIGQVAINPNTTITSSQIVYIYNQNTYIDVNNNAGHCSSESQFTINIVDTSLFVPVSGCGSYTLAPIAFGNYYTAPMGGGSVVNPNIPITSSQTVYYYANTTTIPNCTHTLSYSITIHPLPAVDTITGGTFCGEFILPNLTNGSYYALPGGPSTPGQTALSPGAVIDLSGTRLNPGTYYIYSGPNSNGCVNETNFTININPYPVTDEPINRIECSPYSIPTPTNGTVYTAPGGPNGSGTVVNASDVFSTDNTFFMYNVDPASGCTFDKPFEVYFNGINLPDYSDVTVCDSYSLPVLTHVPPESSNNYSIGYFYNTNGVNPVSPGTVFTSANTPVTIYVYAVNGGRFGIACIEEKSFTVTVSDTPILPALSFATEKCGSYTLPALPTVNYTINYYSQPGGVGLISPAEYTFSTPDTYTVYVYATATNNVNCNDETQFTFTVHPLLDIDFPDGTICVDPTTNQTIRPYTINTGLNPAIYTVDWYLGSTLMGTGPTYTATQEGTYDVRFTKLTPDIGSNCNYKDTQVIITKSSRATATITMSDAFQNQIDLIVNITGGFGTYEFSLDNPDGPYQSSNVFHNVVSGDHLIYIRDVSQASCGDLILMATVLHYPNFFTPNGDGINDLWNIWDLKNQSEATINIYDRYGKLLKQIYPTDPGWDGTLNGHPLPSTDYWFQVFYKLNDEDREFKAHFSMKR
ncbi:MAG TPA: choice-of-anchor L domain-containing protein [Flavobacterium sp.]|uniref:T9SS type B sorting domain-containing protein n=1 Tax=Flavobacterium sp. TaxID=239 RepID=UPI002CF33824|nr:choice-of-anchor L domain-containing protein [Flavobacterium sp.]HSD15513.1 choice-of-anchor L domain-containing protein [Flavobacterium sp.]